jgi:predicted dehydrogenase
MAMFKMESGATVNWLISRGGTGSYGGELILGDQGCINGFGARGSWVSMKRRDEEEIPQEDILASVDGFALEPLAEHLFPSRVTNKDSKVDWKIIALEYYELAEAILNGREIEVDGLEGLKDVAAIYAIFESARVGRAVKMSEVESRQVYNYQSEIDEVLGLV